MKTTVCHKNGCYETAVEGHRFCSSHLYLEQEQEARRRNAAMRKKSSAWHGLYNSVRWRNMSRDFLKKYPFCAVCGAPARIADHIQPHRGDELLFWDELNLQPLCWKHHSAKTLKENDYFKSELNKKGIGV